jgi:mRNA-degrading endonuclease RelE of RelBE toxin-antitoxin system
MWNVRIARKAAKQLDRISAEIQSQFDLLFKELEIAGPLRSNWRNYGRLKEGENAKRYHCHIKTGRPTYVACWEVVNKDIRLIEVYYVGTHEKAPY